MKSRLIKKSILINLMVILFVIPSLFSQNEENIVKSQTPSLNTDSIFKKNPILKDKLLINTGIYFPSKSFNISADGSSDNNDIDFDETFDF